MGSNSTRLTKEVAPWAFERSQPYQCISILEVLATTAALLVFASLAAVMDVCDAVVSVTGFTVR